MSIEHNEAAQHVDAATVPQGVHAETRENRVSVHVSQRHTRKVAGFLRPQQPPQDAQHQAVRPDVHQRREGGGTACGCPAEEVPTAQLVQRRAGIYPDAHEVNREASITGSATWPP